MPETDKSQDLRDSIAEAMGFPTESGAIDTTPRLKELAAKGLREPYRLDEKETQELCAAVMRHIDRYGRM